MFPGPRAWAPHFLSLKGGPSRGQVCTSRSPLQLPFAQPGGHPIPPHAVPSPLREDVPNHTATVHQGRCGHRGICAEGGNGSDRGRLCKGRGNSRVLPGETDLSLTVWDGMHRGDPESLGVSHNFPIFFFFSFFPYLGFVQERNPWVRSLAHSHKYDSLNLPRGRKEAKRDDSASEVSSRAGGLSEELWVLLVSALHGAAGCLAELRPHRRKEPQGDFTGYTAQPALRVCPVPRPGPYRRVGMNSASPFLFSFLLRLCCYPGNLTPSACVLPGGTL